MVPNKFNMIDLDGLDIIESQGVIVSGLYDKLVESIALCRYQCIYNWKFNSIPIPPTYVELDSKVDGVWINNGIVVSQDDIIHIYTLEPEPPVINPLNVVSNGVYNVSEGVTGFNPVTVQVPPPSLVSKKIIANGIYYPGEGEDGFSFVEVEVEGGATLTELFKANDYSGVPVADIVLSDEANNYDMLIINPVYVYSGENYTYAMIMSEPGYGNWYVGINVSGSVYLNIGLNSDLKSFFIKASSAINSIYSVYGIKKGE